MMVIATVALTAEPETSSARAIKTCYDVIRDLREAKEVSDYQMEQLLEAARQHARAEPSSTPFRS